MSRITSLFLLLLLFAIRINAQRYNFENFSVDQGLAQSEIYAVCEDSRGYLWIGTYGGGIVKFDGFTFTTFREENGLANNYVLSILEDYKGILWIGTEKGISTFDGHAFHPFLNGNEGLMTAIPDIVEDKDKNIWLATSTNGVFKVNNDTILHYSTDNGFPDNSIHCLYAESNGRIWAGTNRGAASVYYNSVQVVSQSDGLSSNTIRGICQDKKGNMWFASYNSGLDCLVDDNIRNFSFSEELYGKRIFTTYCDKKGNIWLGTSGGVVRFDGTSFKTFNDASGLPNNVILSIYEDTFGDMWFGTSGGGLSRFDSERFVHFPENEYMGRMIYTLLEALNGNMIFGTSKGGLTVFDGKQYSLLKEDMNFTSSTIKALFYGKDSALWIGTLDDGCFRFDKKGFKKYTVADGLSSNNVTGFTSDILGNLLISSIDSGLSIIPLNADTILKFNVFDGLSSNVVYSLAVDSFGIIWVGTNRGLNKLVPTPDKNRINYSVEKLTHLNGLTSNAIRTIAVDFAGTVFIGTAGGGINIIRRNGIVPLSENNGLSSNNIYSLIFDNNHNLWAGTEKGIDKIIFDAGYKVISCRHFGRNEGFRGIELNRNSSCIDKSGKIWFGTVNGATMYNPIADDTARIKPKIQISGLKLFFNKIENTKYADTLTPWSSLPKTLSLPYKENTLTFEFLGVYLRNPKSVKYKWKLEGFDNDWSPAQAQKEVTYAHIPPGKYTFKVISCNENNDWNDVPAEYSFEIMAPIWQKTWFKLTGYFLIFALITTFILLQFRRLKRKNKAIQDRLRMERNIIELQQEAARLQMNPHFIFNSLNSIQGFISAENASEAKKYLAKFARLMRLILENAREEFIPLANEIDILENYMELEKLSSNHKFNFVIDVNESIDTESLEIPPMMIQPFVENAIIHGIKKKEGKGQLKIEFKTNDNTLVCEITDDGIGRKKSAEIKAKTPAKHKSTGIKVTEKRLEQLQIQSGMEAGFEIVDLYTNDIPCGTKVIVRIPFEAGPMHLNFVN